MKIKIEFDLNNADEKQCNECNYNNYYRDGSCLLFSTLLYQLRQSPEIKDEDFKAIILRCDECKKQEIIYEKSM